MPKDVGGGKINVKTLQITIRNIILEFKLKFLYLKIGTFYCMALNTTAYFVTFFYIS